MTDMRSSFGKGVSRNNQACDDYAAAAYTAAVRTAVIAGVFSLIVLVIMLINQLQMNAADPRYAGELASLKTRLHKHAADERIKTRIRDVDLNLRLDYLRRIDFAYKGGYLLLVGVAALLIAIPAAAQYRERMLLPDMESDVDADARRNAILARQAVFGLGLVALGAFVALAVASRNDLNTSFARAVRDYEKNPPPAFGTPAANPLAGLPPGMLVNLAGRKSAQPSAVPAGSTLPLPATSGQVGAPGPVAALPPASPLALGTVAKRAESRGQRAEARKQAVFFKAEAAFDKSDYSPSTQDFARNWPVFRGPACGMADGDYLLNWNGKTGDGVLWKTDIPLPGWNSPVVWKNKVFLSGATATRREVYCLDTESGKILWKQAAAFISKGKPTGLSEDAGYVPSTLAVDGRRVFAIFPNGDLYCFDTQGNPLWARALGVPESMYGYASSLAMSGSLLIVQYDQSSGDDGKSSLIALQGGTGKIVWRAARPVANSWSSPIVTLDTHQVITAANPWTIAYDPSTGKEIWRASLLSGDVAPSPAYFGNRAYVCNSGAVLACIRTSGRGDVTKSHVAWQAGDGLPDITSPATNGELVFLLTSEGTVTCYDAKAGNKLWEHSYETAFRASPVIVGKRVFLLDSEGVMHIIGADKSFREEKKLALGENAQATPAFVDGRIYIRGVKHLFCIGAKR